MLFGYNKVLWRFAMSMQHMTSLYVFPPFRFFLMFFRTVFYLVVMLVANELVLGTMYQVHMEADRKAMPAQKNMPLDLHLSGKPTYKVGNKVLLI